MLAGRRLRHRLPAIIAFVTALILAGSGRSQGATYYVDAASSSCSDSGSGSSSTPYCTITRAVTDRSGPGNTILVRPATYPELVTVSTPGSSGNPFVLQAIGTSPTSPVIVSGADDFSGTSKWSLLSGNVYRASTVTWNPLQVYKNNVRLTVSTLSPASLPANTFVYVSGQGLYVNIGGGNPGSQQMRVGRRSYGFRLSGKPYVNITGFTVMHTEDRSIYLSSGSDNCEITGNTVTLSNKYGIGVTASSGVLVKSNVVSYGNDHGIYLTNGATGCTIQENESFGHARLDTRAANGIHLNGAPNNLLQRNRVHDNQDSGFQLNTSSNNNLSLQNVSWNNGDHGFDHLTSTGNVHIGDVAYNNFKDGFSIEGNSPNTTVVDCIGVDNGITSNEYNLWVDSNSSVGLVSNYNVFWNSTSQPIVKRGTSTYSTLPPFCAATGHDCNSTKADPRFVNAAAGNFRLLAGSPAIDSASSSIANWPVTDAEGLSRFDDPNIPNSGQGPPLTYADRGAHEFSGASAPNQAPDSTIDTPPSSLTILTGQAINFSGTGTDPDSNIPFTYAWSFGGGAPSSTLEDPGNVVFTTAGTFTVTFTVTDLLGASDPTPDTVVVTVDPNGAPNGVIDLPTGNIAVRAGGSVTFAGTGTDPEGNTPFTYFWNMGGGAVNKSLEDPGTVTVTATAGTYTVTFTVTDSLGKPDPTPDSRVMTVTQPPNSVIISPSTTPTPWPIRAGQSVNFLGSGSDPDNDLPLTYLWDYGGAAPNSTALNPGPTILSIPGTYTISLTITDGLGIPDPTPSLRTILVNPNQSPAGTIEAPAGNPTITAGDPVSFASSGTDPESDPLTFSWNFGGGAANLTTQNPGNVLFATPGTYTVTLTVGDTLGAVDPTPETRVVTANPNQEPDGAIDSPAADTFLLVGQSLDFQGTVGDPDGTLPLTFAWSFGGGAADTTVEDPGIVTFHTPGIFTVTFTVRDRLGLADSTPGSRVITVNAPPLGTIDTPSGDASLTAGDFVTFAASVTDPDNSTPFAFHWSFGAGGPPDSTVEDPGDVIFPASGTYTVTFNVTDSYGTAALTPATRVVTVAPNQAPGGAIDAPGGDRSITAGDGVTFEGTGTDPDNNTPLSFLWDFGGGSANSTLEDPGRVVFGTVGTFTVTFTVTDRLGVSYQVPYERVITVTPNTPPDGTILTPGGDRLILAGESLDFTASSHDPDGHMPLRFVWDFDGGATNSTLEDPGLVTFATPGIFTVTFTVTDSLGGVDPSPASVVITVNQEPDGSIDTPVAPVTTLTAGDMVSFSATSLDPDANTPLSFLWSFGGGAADSTDEDPGAVQFATPGTYTVTFTVTDSRGTPDPTPPTRVVTVNPNSPPEGSINTPGGDQTLTAGDGPIFTGTGMDPDNNTPLTFLWDFGGGAANSTLEDPGFVVFSTPGIYTVTFTVTDRIGMSDPTPYQRVITVTPNDPPDGTIDTPASDTTITAGGSVVFAGSGTDPDNHTPLTFQWSFGAGGPAGRTVEDPGPVTFPAAGSYTVTLTVRDRLGKVDATPASRVITVNPNEPPNGVIDTPAADISINPGQSVSFTGTGTDPDGTTPLSYRWTFGGAAADSTTEDPGAVAFTTTPGTYTVTLTVTDAVGLADPSPATRVVRVNQAPDGTIVSPSAATTTIAPGQSVTFGGSGSDPDGDMPLAYAWSFGGGAAGSTAQSPGAVSFPTPGTYTVTFTVTDALGLADPSPATRVVRVALAPDSTIVTPSAATTTIAAGQSVTFEGSGSDPDGDTPLAYAWSFGGGAAGSTAQSPGAVSFPTPGTYTVTFTVTDALGLADPSPATRVVIVDARPNGVIDAPSGNVTVTAGQSISFTGTGTDPDGHTPLTYLWTFGAGGPSSHTVEDPGAVTFATAGTYTVTFTVTDNLGFGDLTPATLVVTVNSNLAPNGVIDTPTGSATISAGQSVSFTGTGTDPDTTVPLGFLWTFGAGGPASRTAEDPGAVTFPAAGTYTVTFTVTDALGLADPTPDSRVITVSAQTPTIVEKRIVASSDDAEDRGGSTSLTSSDLEMTLDGVTQVVGLRFTALALPRNATITNAYVQFTADEAQTTATSLTIQAQAIDNAPTFTTAANNVSSRARTAGVGWSSIPQWSIGAAGADQRTPNLAVVIQEIVNRPGWASGNALAIIITGTGHRTAYAYDGSTSLAALLHVEYTTGPPPNQAPNGVIDTPAGNTAITAGQSLSFTGTGSDPDGNTPLSFLWSFGAGGPASRTVEDPGAVTFPTPGTYTVSFTVTDGLSLADPTPATRVVTVNANQAPNGVIDTPAGSVSISPGQSVSFTGTGSDPDGTTPFTFLWSFGAGGPASRTVEDPGSVTFDSIGTYTVTFTVTDALGLADPSPATRVVSVGNNLAPDGAIDTPVGNPSITAGESIAFTGTASDPDGNTPLAYVWTFGAGGPASRTVEDPGAVTFPTAGTFTVTFTVTDSLGSADPTPATRLVTVNSTGVPNLVGNPSFETDTSGWSASGGGTIARTTAAAHDGSACLQMTGPATTAKFGVNDSPNWTLNSGAAGTRYRFSAYVRTPTSGSHGSSEIRVREYVSGTQVGPTTYSTLVPLTSGWQLVTVDYITTVASSALDMQVLNNAAVTGEVYQVDSISIRAIP